MINFIIMPLKSCVNLYDKNKQTGSVYGFFSINSPAAEKFFEKISSLTIDQTRLIG